MDKRGILILAGVAVIFLSLSFSSAFILNGTVKDETGIPLNNSNVNVTIRSMEGWSVVGYNSTTTNGSGWFNLNVAEGAGWVYELSISHFNGSYCDFRSKTIPALDSTMMTELAGTTYYLALAGTINITANNGSSGRVAFQYQIKDTKLGYPIAENHESYVMEAVIYVPSDRNYSIMIYPNQSMPVSYDWYNFSSVLSYNQTFTKYDAQTKTLHKQFNITMRMARVSGYFNLSEGGWDEFTVVPYLLEPGNMIHCDYGDMPYNMSAIKPQMLGDVHTLSSGFYNITLPATVESSTIMLFAAARNGTNYYGGFKNISITYGGAAETTGFNFLFPRGLLGTPANISMDVLSQASGPIYKNISTKKQRFGLVNLTNASLTSTSAHSELTVDYTSLGAREFTWMCDSSQTQATAYFEVPLLNATGVKEINVYASGGPGGAGGEQYAPKSVAEISVSEIMANSNITIRPFNPQALDGSSGNYISIELFSSNSTCDVPNPNGNCSLTGTSTMSEFGPMQYVMGGGKISFRMGMGGVLVHYVNVDMLASGPPDALFENNNNISETTTGGFSKIMKFGSQGPKIYDYVLVSLPYTEGNHTTSGLNETAPVNISIPLFYDDNWNLIWNVSANGSASALAGNYSHYAERRTEWLNLTTQKTCTTANVTSAALINSTSPCYIDITNNRIWIRLPHFSGAGPEGEGDGVTDSTKPVITSVSASVSTTSATISWTTDEAANSSVAYGTSTSMSSRTASSTRATSRSISLTGLDSSTLYHYNVTSCDAAGNCNSTSRYNFTTSSAGTSSTEDTSGGAAGAESYWTMTYAAPTNDTTLKTKGYTQALAKRNRMKIKVGSDYHYVGIISVTSTEAVINVTSTPQTATFKVGETKKFEVTDDDYYDLSITLNSINNSKANITAYLIYEKMPEEAASQAGGATTASGNKTLGVTGAGGIEESWAKKNWAWLIIGLIGLAVIILAVVVVIYYKKLKKAILARSIKVFEK